MADWGRDVSAEVNIKLHEFGIGINTTVEISRHTPVTADIVDRQIRHDVSISEPLKYIRGSPGHVITTVRPAAPRGRLVHVVGGSDMHDVTRGLDDVSDESRRVGKSRLLLMFVLFPAFVRAELLQSALPVLLYQHLMKGRTATTSAGSWYLGP